MEVKVNFSKNQKDKIKSAFKKKVPVSIQFKIDQLSNGNDDIILTKRQYNKLEKHKKNNKGIRIEFSYNQLKELKNGGKLLKDLLDFGEDIPVVKNVVPYVRKAAPIVKKDVIPIVRNILNWLDKELEDVVGSGLDEKTLNHVKSHIKKNLK